MNINKQLKSIFESNDFTMDYLKFKKVEFVIYVIYSVMGDFEFNSTNLFFTQYNKLIGDNKLYSGLFYMLRKRYHQYYSKNQVTIDFEEYFEIPSKYRYFSLYKTQIIKNNDVKYMVDRDRHYGELVEQYTNDVFIDNAYIEGQGYYDRIIRLGDRYSDGLKSKKFEFDLGDYPDETEIVMFQEYMEKKELKLPIGFDWDEYKYSLGGDWGKRPSININSCGNFDTHINYKGNIHIVGLLGAGKSTYIIQETVRLLSENKIKIGIVEPNVQEVIKVYESLKELGIKVVPIIGAAQLDKHRERYMNSRFNYSESFNDIIDESNEALDYLSSYCELASYSNDEDILPSQYPCNRLKKEGISKNFNCPLSAKCGYFSKYTELLEAEVWITTSHSLLASKCNNIIDRQKRTYYELFHDILDIIFVDEADSVQADFDDFFMSDEVFYGNRNSIMKKFQRVEELLRNNQFGNIESETHRWIVNFSHLSQLINRIEYLVTSSPAYRDFLLESTITPRSVLYSTVGHLLDPESEESEKFLECLESFLPLSEELKLNEELMNHELFTLYDQLSKAPNIGSAGKIIDELMDDFIGKYDLILKKSKTIDIEKLFKKKLELYIYIVLIDYFFRIQNTTIDTLGTKIPEVKSIYSSFRFYNKEFIHLLSESVIGNVFGYKFVVDEDNRVKLHLFNYSGVGRSLLENWSNIKSELKKHGPAIVMLSGTSFAPESAHFHINEEPTFILESERKEGAISQFILQKYDSKDRPIKVSGIHDQIIKKENLRLLTKSIVNDIKFELKYWLDCGENRKVMLIVNSYEQCRIVGDQLRGSGLSYGLLSNKKELGEDEINTSQIEQIPSQGNIEVLIAPLSIISRGYNIIDQNGNSYFGSTFFMIRPYISPDDLKYNYRVINSMIAPIVKKNLSLNYTLDEAMSKVRKFTYGLLNKLNEKKFWKLLDPDQRAILSWYTYIPIKQTVGRMQRNGCSCRVFYSDASFANNDALLSEDTSMLKAWENNLLQTMDHTGKLLYGNYLEGLSKAIADFDELNTCDPYVEEIY